ncbi:MAG: outer membrane protein assembly factor BamA [Deltaproteobacteria bacterium]|nr:outer membrane protein assembly factor BamA [Deltaproteobacteria bacterium]
MRPASLLCCLMAWGVWLCAPALAEPLSAVKVRGNKRVEPDAVRVVVTSQPGEELDPAKVARDIKAIFGLGFFADVRAEVEKGEEGEELVFVVVEKPSIASIAYRGNEEIDTDKIEEVIDIKPLSVLDVLKIKANAKKIKDLYVEKGYFLADVDYELTTQDANNVKLTFVILERAKIAVKRITFIGNEKIPSEDLADIMETREGGFFSWLTSSGTYKEDALKRDRMRLSEYYYNNGYLNVSVSEPVVEISPDRKHLYISFAIEEGERYRFGKLGFGGDLLVEDEMLLKEIEAALDEKAATIVLSEELERALAARLGEAEIRALKMTVLRDLAREAESRIERGVWEEDEPHRSGPDALREQVRAELLVLLKSRVLGELLMVETGEMFNKQKLGMSLFRVQDVYKDRGYAYVDVIPETNIDSEARIIDLNFKIQKGHKVYIERIEIKGNSKTRDKVIRRQMRIYEGDYYSGRGLERSKRRVNSLGFFEKVEVAERRGSAPDKAIISVTVKERQTGTFQIGAGFSSVENFIITAQIAQQNLFGRGQTLSLMAQLSSLRQYFSVQFIEPYFLDTKWYLATSLFNTQLDYINFLRKATGGNVTLGYEFADNWRVAFTYTLETVDVSAGRGTATGLRLSNLFKDGWTSSVRGTITWDTRNNQLFPSDGHFIQGSVEHASKYTLSDNDFTRFSAVGRYYYPIIWGIVLKSNLSLGYLLSTGAEGLPIFEKYFAGGIYTVRGYEPRSIGPRLVVASQGSDPGSHLTVTNEGGNKQLIANLELEFPIFPQVNIRGVVFLDAGNAYGEGEHLFAERYNAETGGKETWLGLYWSTGFGFRWFSPIGPLRFEWGIPLTRRPQDKDILFEFTIGNFF